MKKIRNIHKGTIKFAVVICLILSGVLVVCGLPLEETKESLKTKLKNF